MSLEGETPSLRELLERERDCCARLAPILEAERSAAAAYDHLALLACLKEREAIQAEWQRVAQLRRRRMREGGAELAALVGRDPSLAAAVAAVRQQAAAVRRAQRVNEGLIRAALKHVTDVLTVIRRELPESRYDRRASLTVPLPAAPSGSWSA